VLLKIHARFLAYSVFLLSLLFTIYSIFLFVTGQRILPLIALPIMFAAIAYLYCYHEDKLSQKRFSSPSNLNLSVFFLPLSILIIILFVLNGRPILYYICSLLCIIGVCFLILKSNHNNFIYILIFIIILSQIFSTFLYFKYDFFMPGKDTIVFNTLADAITDAGALVSAESKYFDYAYYPILQLMTSISSQIMGVNSGVSSTFCFVLLSVSSITLIFLIGKKIFHTISGGLFSAFLFSCGSNFLLFIMYKIPNSISFYVTIVILYILLLMKNKRVSNTFLCIFFGIYCVLIHASWTIQILSIPAILLILSLRIPISKASHRLTKIFLIFTAVCWVGKLFFDGGFYASSLLQRLFNNYIGPILMMPATLQKTFIDRNLESLGSSILLGLATFGALILWNRPLKKNKIMYLFLIIGVFFSFIWGYPSSVFSIPLINSLLPYRWLIICEFFVTIVAVYGIERLLDRCKTKKIMAILIICVSSAAFFQISSPLVSQDSLPFIENQNGWGISYLTDGEVTMLHYASKYSIGNVVTDAYCGALLSAEYGSANYSLRYLHTFNTPVDISQLKNYTLLLRHSGIDRGFPKNEILLYPQLKYVGAITYSTGEDFIFVY